MKKITACFTGHRDIPGNEIPKVIDSIFNVTEKCIEKGYRFFLTGGALSFDTLAALVVLKLKQTYRDIKLILVLPCYEQAKFWTEKDIKLYEKIKKEADEIIYTSDHYFSGCMLVRNRYMIDNSGLCICYLKKTKGGTAYTANYAMKSGIEIINLANSTGFKSL